MSGLVIVFFIGSAVATLLIGLQFARSDHESLKYFGWGLVAVGIGFAFWAIARIIDPDDPDDLEIWVTIGVFFLLVGLLAFLYSWTSQLEQKNRNLVLLGGLGYIVVLVVLRFIYPSEAFIDDDGLFFFNPHGSVGVMEAGALTFAVLPAMLEVARHLRSMEALVLKVCTTTLVVGGIILILSLDTVAVTVDGWAMGAALVALLLAFVVRQPNQWLADRSS